MSSLEPLGVRSIAEEQRHSPFVRTDVYGCCEVRKMNERGYEEKNMMKESVIICEG